MFEAAFDKAATTPVRGKGPSDHIDVLLEQSKTFYIGEIEFNFDEEEKIFFLSGPNPKKNMVQKCATCQSTFKDYKNMIYCTFCSFSNCKKCMQKTRAYPCQTLDAAAQLSASGKEKQLRGQICKLCDRKFLIRDMLVSSSKQIKMYNLVIASTLEQRKTHERDIAKLEEDHERDFASNNYHCTQLENENKKLNDVLLRKEEDLIQSRVENDELERR